MSNQHNYFHMESHENSIGNQKNLQEMKFQETTIEKNIDGSTRTTIQSFEGTPEEIETMINNNNQ